MCGRFTLTIDPNHLQEAFPWADIPDDLSPRYNIAPSQPVAVIPNTGDKTLAMYKWGLIPSWSKDPAIGDRMINARSETLAEKPSFRNPYRRRRCLISGRWFLRVETRPNHEKQATHVYSSEKRPTICVCWTVGDMEIT